MSSKTQLCIALDNPSLGQNLALLQALDSLDSQKKQRIWLKVGLRSFIRDGIGGLELLKRRGDYKIFLDLKLYDIPNTMLDSITECAKLGIDMLTIHTSCGKEAMRAIADLKNHTPSSIQSTQMPLIVGVTALTSFEDSSFSQIYNAPLFSHALNLAKLAYECGIDGVVCSTQESLAIKQSTDSSFLTITPGIRPFGEDAGDQKRVASLQDALDSRSDFAVIGRPIYKAQNPLQVVENILQILL